MPGLPSIFGSKISHFLCASFQSNVFSGLMAEKEMEEIL